MSDVKKAVIPAAGWGTRFLPIVKAVPKSMLPVIDTPPIHYVVDDAVAAGCEMVYIVTTKGQEAIQWYFNRSDELERVLEKQGKLKLVDELRAISDKAEIRYLMQKEQRGLGDAIYCARKDIGDEDFHVLLGDDIIINPKGASCSKQLTLAHRKYSAPAFAIQNVPDKDVGKFGIVEGTLFDSVKLNGEESMPVNLYRVKRLVEKPKPEEKPSNMAIIGRYIFPPEIFEHIKKTSPGVGGEIQITDAMNELNREKQFIAVEFEGKRYDLGNKLDKLIADIEIGMERDDIGQGLKEYLNSPEFRKRLEGRRADEK